jgi:hypothetical protein
MGTRRATRCREGSFRTYPNTGVNGASPFKTACTFATAIAAIWRRASCVALPM